MTVGGANRSNKSANVTGSPGQGEPVYLAVARIRKPHGVSGEMLAAVLTDFPERLQRGQHYWMGDSRQKVVISEIRHVSKGILLRLEGVNTPEAAGNLRNQYLYSRSTELPALPDGEYYHHQLIGLRAESENGEFVGTVAEIITTGANDVYVINTPLGKEILLPAIASVILQVLLGENRIIVRLQEWV